MTRLFSLSGEVALVTGASRGIGAAIADRLAHAGATVIGTATTEAGATGITQRITADGHRGRGLVLDVCRPEAIEAVRQDIEQAEGIVSILVNNAGITRDNLVLRMKDDEWNAVIATNLTATFQLSRAFLRGMLKQRRGRVINIASVVGAMGNPGQANYAAAKAGLLGLTKSLAREVGSRGITVNVVAPGFIATDMTAGMTAEQRQALQAQVPLQRLGSASDVANAVLFLASAEASYITGETLHVNGGMYMI
ncbi:MAG: 3-oxoacyl-ACP reductase FabG [Gammaproteobacteria bacterium]|nr:MAG: 3-oxoacyl-ACP reductase FabG [Gammaproteobacteria bacterium]